MMGPSQAGDPVYDEKKEKHDERSAVCHVSERDERIPEF